VDVAKISLRSIDGFGLAPIHTAGTGQYSGYGRSIADEYKMTEICQLFCGSKGIALDSSVLTAMSRHTSTLQNPVTPPNFGFSRSNSQTMQVSRGMILTRCMVYWNNIKDS